jgi:TatD DNase family protein
MDLVDSHCHLDDDALQADLPQVLARAQLAGVRQLLIPAISARLWPRLRALVNAVASSHAAYGLHPMYLDEHRPEHLKQLAQWIEREHPVAVGECGLDLYLPKLDPATQIEYFVAQIQLAREYDLPLVIHARRAVDEVCKYLRRHRGCRGVVHSFSGSREQALRLFELGFRIGIGGPVTYPRAKRLRGVVASVPIEMLLLETDAPDQPGAGHRGERNEPAHIAEVLETVAALRATSAADVAAATSRNARELFGFDEAPASRGD